jgi:hypothetical protein
MPLLTKSCAKCDKRILPFIGQYKTIDGLTICAECYLNALKQARKKKAQIALDKIANGSNMHGRTVKPI